MGELGTIPTVLASGLKATVDGDLLCRKVTSTPFPVVPGSGWYGHKVCNVEVCVRGPLSRLEDVGSALGSALYTDYN